MSNNGEAKHELLKVTLQDGKMKVTFGKYNMALIGHGIRMANLQLDAMICTKEMEAKKDSPIIQPLKDIRRKIIGS